MHRAIHPDFKHFLQYKDEELIKLYSNLRNYVLSIYPDCNELLYHTHALTSLYSVSEKMSDGFCVIPIYTSHLNLGFNLGSLLQDPHKLLQGTGKLMRHIPVKSEEDFDKPEVQYLLQQAIDLALEECNEKSINQGKTISKIKR